MTLFKLATHKSIEFKTNVTKNFRRVGTVSDFLMIESLRIQFSLSTLHGKYCYPILQVLMVLESS